MESISRKDAIHIDTKILDDAEEERDKCADAEASSCCGGSDCCGDSKCCGF